MTAERTLNPEWMARGACLSADPELFYPEYGTDVEPAKGEAMRICRDCPVRRQCLRFAFRTGDRFAVLGGTTPHQRSRIRSRMAKLGRKV